MGVFNNLEDFFASLDKHIPLSLIDIAIKIQKDMRIFWLESVYSSRSEHYEYTEMLLNSAKVSEPKKVGNEWTIEIYISDTEMHKNPAWYKLSELGIDVGDQVSLFEVAERMAIIERSEDIMETMKEKWLDNKVALNYILERLKEKYSII